MPKHTVFHDIHLALGAKMGEFAGYDMPLYYPEGVIKEHEWVRSAAGMFDVSHMGQVIITGEGVAEFLERITPSAFQPKIKGRAQYTVLTNPQGGIIDDLIITRLAENIFFLVLNAGCKDKDIAWITQHMPKTLSLNHLKEHALVAVQGPQAEQAISDVLQVEVSDMPYMFLQEATLPDGARIFISRLGYTGEDGFEISVPNASAVNIWNAFLNHTAVKPAGLAARDSLRLEMGYALYGHDIDETTSPIEADIGWIIGKNNSGFIGAERVLKDREEGSERKRVGIRLLDRGVAREGAEILTPDGKPVGTLTSGGFSPSLKASVGQGYVETGHANSGEKLTVNVRGRPIDAEVAALPFIPAKTKSMKKTS